MKRWIVFFEVGGRELLRISLRGLGEGEIEATILQRGGKLLENCELFDIYEGSQILPGFKSMAYSLTFRALDHTLDEKEISGAMNKILNALESMGIELRK